MTNNQDSQHSSSNTSALARIRSKILELAPAEREVAHWILKHPEQVIDSSMAQLAQTCGVSDTTVLRFCRTAGFQGYTDLKLSLVRDMSNPTQIIHDDIYIDDDPVMVAQKVFLSNIQAIRDTLEVLDGEAFTQAVDMLDKARADRVLIVGVGTSGPFVQAMHNMLFRLGYNCQIETDAYLQLMKVALLGPGDVTICITQSGSSVDPILTLEQARRSGASTICITGNAHSPIAEHSDITLLSVSSESRAETIASRVAQLTLLDALYVALSLRNLDTAVKNEKLIWDAVIRKAI